MTSARAQDTVSDPAQLLDMLDRLYRRLHGLGVTIALADLPPATIADWTSANRTVTIRRTTTIEELYHCLLGVLNLIVIGPHAATGAIPLRPQLRLVPSMRAATG